MTKKAWDKIFSGGRDFSTLNEVFLSCLIKRVKEILGLSRLKTAIDLGAGTGDAAIKLAKLNLRVQALDWSGVALANAKEKAEKEKVLGKITFTETDIEKLEEKKLLIKNPDMIFCKLVIAFLKNKNGFVEKIKQLMGPKMVFILITPVVYKKVSYEKEDKPGIAEDFDEISKILKNNFSFVEIFHHEYFGNKGDIVTFLAK